MRKNIFAFGGTLLLFALAFRSDWVLNRLLPNFSAWEWVFRFLSCAAAFTVLAVGFRNQTARMLSLVVMACSLGLGLTEIVLVAQSPTPPEQRHLKGEEIRKAKNDPEARGFDEDCLDDNHPALGYAPKPMAMTAYSIKMHGDEIVYDVVYSTLPSGWRVTPQNSNARSAVIFFGCSYTFGEGLNDGDTFPFKVGERLGSDFQVFNFGLSGYGSHQMLAQIESGFLDEPAKKYGRMFVFYTTIYGHELRSGGYSHWDRHGPRYILNNGNLERVGTFADIRESPATQTFRKIFQNSKLYQRLRNSGALSRLHVAIMSRADKLLQERYNTRLCVILWPGAPYGALLREAGVPYIAMGEIFPEMQENKNKKYHISEYDGHPNSLATDALADLLVKKIVTHYSN
ncbi:MAG: hypothetical protein LBB60_08570 [Desulfovibrio sp.]|jgi:hypothetical protein|nr:hypothetical protein [Desulfovibrio sp.]